jgi:ankyrin repeat protein
LHPEEITQVGPGGCLPIHFCTVDGSLDALSFLAEKNPAAIMVADQKGRVPAHHICLGNKISTFEKLEMLKVIAKYTPYGYESFKSNSTSEGLPFHAAINNESNSVDVIDFMVTMYPECLDIKHNGKLPLELAKHCSVFEYLIMIQYRALIKQGMSMFDAVTSDVMIADKDLMIQKMFNLLDGGRVFERSKNGAYPIHTIFGVSSNPDLVSALVDMCVDSTFYQDCNGRTPLHYAMYHGAGIEQIERLFVNDINIECLVMSDKDGLLPIHTACKYGASLEVVKYLVECGPDTITSLDNLGRSPLHVACSGISLSVIQYLIRENEAGILVQQDIHNETPLHKACRVGNLYIIDNLLSREPLAITIRNDKGELPFHLLCVNEGKYFGFNQSVHYFDTLFRLLVANPETVHVYG